jgi:hypothetical protein
MAFQPVPDTAQFRFEFEGTVGGLVEGLTAMFSLYGRNTTAPGWDTGRLASTADALRVEWLATGAPLLSSAWTLRRIMARDIGAEFGLFHDEGVSAAGTRVGAVSPPSISLVARFHASAAGAPRKGWVHAPYGVEADIDGERWTVGFLNDCQTHFAAMRDAIDNAEPFNASVIVSRHSGTAAPVEPIKVAVKRVEGVTNTVGAVSMREIIGSQRDRRT